MAGAKGVVFAFATAWKTSNPLRFAQVLHFVTATGENLVRISLVAYVPYQFVVRGVEYIMQRDGQFYYTQIRGQVAAGLGNASHKKCT